MSPIRYAIACVRDIEQVEEKILGDLTKNRLTYFSLVVQDEAGFSSCFFTPTAITSKGEGSLFFSDYGKIVRLLLSHPNVRHIEYDPQEHAISAVFEDPYGAEDRDKYDLYYEGFEEKPAREVAKK